MFIHADYITDIEERNNVDNWFVVLTMLVSIFLHIIGECKFNRGLNTFINCNSIHFRTFLCFSVIDLVYLSMLFTSFKSVSQHSSAQSSSRHPPGHHGCDRETGLRRGAAHTDKRERERKNQTSQTSRRGGSCPAQGSPGSGQHYWCCLPGASDIGAGLVVAVVVEQ